MLAIGLFVLIPVFGVGCAEPKTEPKSVQNESLAGRPPWAFPSRATEADKLEEMRRHLEGIERKEPTTSVLAHVLLRRPITLDEYDMLRTRYSFQGGPRTSYLGVIPNVAVSGMSFPSTDDLPIGEAIRSEMIEDARQMQVITGDQPVDVRIEMLVIHATPRDLLRLWSDEPDLIRGVGIDGRRGADTMMWTPIRPEEGF